MSKVGPGLVVLWRKALSHGEMLPVWKWERTQSRHKQSHVRIHTDAKGHDGFWKPSEFSSDQSVTDWRGRSTKCGGILYSGWAGRNEYAMRFFFSWKRWFYRQLGKWKEGQWEDMCLRGGWVREHWWNWWWEWEVKGRKHIECFKTSLWGAELGSDCQAPDARRETRIQLPGVASSTWVCL